MERNGRQLTVSVSFWNAERHLLRCLSSLECLLGSDVSVEILLINDGSEDASGEIAQAWVGSAQKNYPGQLLVLIEKSNEGLGVARNISLDNATSDYVAFLDADDEWLPEGTKTLCAYLRSPSDDSDVLSFVMRWTLSGEDSQFELQPASEPSHLALGTPAVQRNIYRRDFLLSQKVRFPAVRFMEDVPFMVAVAKSHPRIVAFNSPLYLYYAGTEGSLTSKRDERWLDVSERLQACCRMLAGTGSEEWCQELVLRHGCSAAKKLSFSQRVRLSWRLLRLGPFGFSSRHFRLMALPILDRPRKQRDNVRGTSPSLNV